MTDREEWRGRVGTVWADTWRQTDRAFAALAPALDATILHAAPDGPFRALDIGCGAGATSLALAAARPDARIVGVDLSSALVAVARARAVEHTSDPGELICVIGEAESVAAAQGPFDLLFSRHGVMFFADPVAAFTALHRSAAPGRALIFSCFGDPALNGFAGPLAAALDLPAPRAGGGPGPFAFADRDDVAALLAKAGWRGAAAQPVAFPYRVGQGPDALEEAVAFLSLIGPAAAALRRTDGVRRRDLVTTLRRYLCEYERDMTVDLPASAWLWSARA